MKNLLTSIPFISLVFILLYCNNSVDSEPISSSDFLASNNSGQIFDIASDQNQTPANKHFSWQPVKTAVIPFGKSLSLTSPYVVTDSTSGDISWIANGEYYAALQPSKVQFCKLGIADINSITTEYLKTLEFKSTVIPSAPVASLSYPNNLPANMVIACKTASGKYFLLQITNVSWGTSWNVQLSVYHGVYEIV